MNPVVLFQRVLVTRMDMTKPNELQEITTLAKQISKRIVGDEDFVPVPISFCIPGQQQNAVFYATEGTAIGADETEHPLRAVYIAYGGYDPEREPNAVAKIKKKADVDFEGFIEQGVRIEAEVAVYGEGEEEHIVPLTDRPAEATVVNRFSGDQSEFFADLSEFAILMATRNRPNTQPDEALLFESPFRWGVATRKRLGATRLSRADLESAIVLGEGVLTWPSVERNTDRYGFVSLWEEPREGSDNVPLSLAGANGQNGLLVAEILETRESPHMGDTFRHIFPERPATGEIIELGSGVCNVGDDHTVGVEPEEHREIDWMNPAALYRCHFQTVRLLFVPRNSQTE